MTEKILIIMWDSVSGAVLLIIIDVLVICAGFVIYYSLNREKWAVNLHKGWGIVSLGGYVLGMLAITINVISFFDVLSWYFTTESRTFPFAGSVSTAVFTVAIMYGLQIYGLLILLIFLVVVAVECAVLILLAFLSQKKTRKSIYLVGMITIFLDFILGEILGAMLVNPDSPSFQFYGPVPAVEIVLLPALFISSAFVLFITSKNLNISEN
ncbi:MAG: hypothetical protein ACXAEU_18890 [Candidatus Hodarchaeales archaeon]|jgi:hypothetical protein